MKAVICQIMILLATSSCAGPTSLREVEVTTWGTMRGVLREGRSEGRVDLATLTNPAFFGVGAMADLAGEVTILDGRVLVATSDARKDGSEEAATPRVREAVGGDFASLLVLANVPRWEEVPVADCASYSELETIVGEQLRQRKTDLTSPQPVRIRGQARHLSLHVIAGDCPVANPSGAAPWRFSGSVSEVELVGFYVENAAGKLTHHNRKSHLHAVSDQLMGHLDDVTLKNVVLLLPAAER